MDHFRPSLCWDLANSLLSLVPTPGGVGAVESGVGGLAVRLSSLTASAAAALVLIDRAITYVSVIVLGALLFLLRHVIRSPQPGDPSRPSQTRQIDNR